MKASAAQDEGFTLVEMLVSLTLMALMSVYALQSLRTISEMQAIGASIEKQAEVEAVAHRLRQEVEGIRPEFTSRDSTGQHLLFDGGKKSVTYVTASNGEREVGGLYVVKLYVNDQHELMMERQRLRTGTALPGETVKLLRNIESLDVSYLPPSESAAPPLEAWQARDQLPAAMQISVQFPPGDNRRWPPLFTGLKLSN
ncbi:MAG: prepilin-type N-terminal cleavage/methylation domain-containing protein [Alphaproteobacteria bacterium]|nr:prepilin-type N-terminal cleavage/methylation domain-containing protein [Alphaproteobacteria bacterium]